MPNFSVHGFDENRRRRLALATSIFTFIKDWLDLDCNEIAILNNDQGSRNPGDGNVLDEASLPIPNLLSHNLTLEAVND